MSDYIKEKVGEWETKFGFFFVEGKEPDQMTLKKAIKEDLLQSLQEMEERTKITEDTSDGYHTFKELYEFRKVYNAALFNEWASQGKYNVHKSIRHHDGELCFGGGWFIVVADLPSGQISNHYELKDWDLFQCEEREKAEEWDGHTPQDVVNRILLLSPKKESGEKEWECNAPCYCHCHCNKKIMCGHAGEYSCPHCLPKKEKRGR